MEQVSGVTVTSNASCSGWCHFDYKLDGDVVLTLKQASYSIRSRFGLIQTAWQWDESKVLAFVRTALAAVLTCTMP